MDSSQLVQLASPDAISGLIGAVGTLGVASSGLVDSCKLLPNGGLSHFGYARLEEAVSRFLPERGSSDENVMHKQVYQTVHANWINGLHLPDQKTATKTLLKTCLTADSSHRFAAATGLEAESLKEIQAKQDTGVPLAPGESVLMQRLETMIQATLDDAYEHADQLYRNVTKFAAMVVSVALALVGGYVIAKHGRSEVETGSMLLFAFAGVLATPLAPITKDLASAIQAGVKVAQTFR